MVTEEQNRLAEQLRAELDAIVAVDIEDEIVREKELGALSFREDRDFLDHVADYCARIRELQWDECAPTQLEKVQQSARGLSREMNRIKQFNLQASGGLADSKTEILRRYERAFSSLQDSATPLVASLMLKGLDIEGMRRSLGSRVDELLGEAKGARDDAQRAAEGALRAEVAARQAAAETGVQRHAGIFDDAAKRHESAAKTWLKRTIGCGLVTVAAVLAVVFGFDVEGGISEANALQIVLAKAVVLAVGLYFTFTAGRIYRANVHLAVVNQHRQDSLSTFEAFVEGAGDDQETKSKLLLEAAHAVFGQVPTGLAPAKEGGNTVEVLDGAASLFRRT